MNNENKVIVKLYVPTIDNEYDVWLPLNKRIYNIIRLMVRAINEFTNGEYNPKKLPILYNKRTAKPYDINLTVKEAKVKNGTEIILI